MGLYNGIILAFSSLMEPVYKKTESSHQSAAFHLIRIVRAFAIVNIGWFFDRSLNGLDAFIRILSLITDWRPNEISASVLDSTQLPSHDLAVLLIGSVILLFVSLLKEKSINLRLTLSTFPFPIR